jgi:hypothetical protein
LKLNCDILVPKFTFKFNLCHYAGDDMYGVEGGGGGSPGGGMGSIPAIAAAAAAGLPDEVGQYESNPVESS